MSRKQTDPFVRQYQTPNRQANEQAIQAFLESGGEIERFADSKTHDQLIKNRTRKQKKNEATGKKRVPLFSVEDALRR